MIQTIIFNNTLINFVPIYKSSKFIKAHILMELNLKHLFSFFKETIKTLDNHKEILKSIFYPKNIQTVF